MDEFLRRLKIESINAEPVAPIFHQANSPQKTLTAGTPIKIGTLPPPPLQNPENWNPNRPGNFWDFLGHS